MRTPSLASPYAPVRLAAILIRALHSDFFEAFRIHKSNITRRLWRRVMFLIIPTIFIIVVITILVLRLGLPSQKLAVLMGIGFYLFIIFGGYYSMFALLAGPYFLFLLIIIGILAFFLGHFGVGRQGGPMHGRAVGGGMPGSAAGMGVARFETMSRNELRIEKDRVQVAIKNVQHQLGRAENKSEERNVYLRQELVRLQNELSEIDTQLNYVKKHTRGLGF